MVAHFKPGDCVIYQKQKYSAHPGPKARSIWPAANGDHYCYCVDKYYRVLQVRPNNEVVVLTRRGKKRKLAADDPALRRARWWQRFLLRRRFPTSPVSGMEHPPT